MNSYALPPLYQMWMDRALGNPVYSEPRATCDECVMCTVPERPAFGDYRFNPNTKCCAYHPSLANFLVGAVLSDDDPGFAGAKDQFVRGALAAKVSPIGVNPTDFTKLFYKVKPFGKHERIRCPFYMHQMGGMCAIWKYRNGRCSTWFCKHDRGRAGFRFWNVLEEMLTFAEQKLATWCVEDLLIFRERSSDWREDIWGNWCYREADFFVACWEKVQPIAWEQVLTIGGSELQSLVVKTKTTFEQLTLPNILEGPQKSNFRSEDVGNGIIRIWSYSPYNPVDLPREIVDALDLFDGRPVETVVAQIENERGVRIDRALLNELADYQILVNR